MEETEIDLNSIIRHYGIHQRRHKLLTDMRKQADKYMAIGLEFDPLQSALDEVEAMDNHLNELINR